MRKEYYQANKAKVLAANAAYQDAHREQISQYNKEWKKKNRLKLLAARKEYYQKNKARSLEASRTYYSAHRQKIVQWQKEYSKANPDVGARTQAKRRRAKLDTLSYAPAIKRWMSDIKSKPFVRCHWCGTKIKGRQVHFDHIVPLAKGGEHSIGNLCASCPECNHTKSARLIADWVCQGQTFLPL